MTEVVRAVVSADSKPSQRVREAVKPNPIVESIRIGNAGPATGVACADATFDRLTLIYGRNGSGKSTLAAGLALLRFPPRERALKDSSLRHDQAKPVEIKTTGINANGQANLHVFDAKFVAEHVYDGSVLQLRGFESGGEISAELTTPEIAGLQDASRGLIQKRSQLQELMAEIVSISESVKRDLSAQFNARVTGSRMPTLSPETAEAEKLAGHTLAQTTEDLEHQYRAFARQQDTLAQERDRSALEEPLTAELKVDFAAVRRLLNAEVSSRVSLEVRRKIDKLSSVPIKGSLEAWFADGRSLLEAVGEERECPLCNSKLPDPSHIISELATIFTGEVDAFVEQLSEMVSNIDVVHEECGRIESRAHAIGQYFERGGLEAATVTALKSAARTLASELRRLRVLLDGRRRSPTRRPEFGDPRVSSVVDLANDVAGLAIEVEKSRAAEWLAISERKFDANKVKLLLKRMHALRLKITFDPSKLAALQGGVTAPRDPDAFTASTVVRRLLDEVDAEVSAVERQRRISIASLKIESKLVNHYLRRLSVHSFGVDIDMLEGKLAVIHADSPAALTDQKSLSEGERFALAFAYFLSKFRHEMASRPVGAGSVDDSIVVIDDPVSSLDEERLHATALVIRDEFVEANRPALQTFILSHNLLFLRFMGNVSRGNRNRVDLQISQGCVRPAPAHLRNYSTSYFLKLGSIMAFAEEEIGYEEVKDRLPNYIRVVLETLLSFKFARLSNGRGNRRFESAGLGNLIGVVEANIGKLPAISASEVGRSNVIDHLRWLERKIDPESHGGPHDLIEMEHIPEAELRLMASVVVGLVEYLDAIHAGEVSGLGSVT